MDKFYLAVLSPEGELCSRANHKEVFFTKSKEKIPIWQRGLSLFALIFTQGVVIAIYKSR
jgi:hypothetical protein